MKTSESRGEVMTESIQGYVGDGCYAEITRQGLVLTTSNGVEETNRIVLEPETWTAVLAFVASARLRFEANG